MPIQQNRLFFLTQYPGVFAQEICQARGARHRLPSARRLSPPRRFATPAFPRARPSAFAHQIALLFCSPDQISTAKSAPPRSNLDATVVAMSRPPCPREAPTGENGFRVEAAAWSSPIRQVPHGFHHESEV